MDSNWARAGWAARWRAECAGWPAARAQSKPQARHDWLQLSPTNVGSLRAWPQMIDASQARESQKGKRASGRTNERTNEQTDQWPTEAFGPPAAFWAPFRSLGPPTSAAGHLLIFGQLFGPTSRPRARQTNNESKRGRIWPLVRPLGQSPARVPLISSGAGHETFVSGAARDAMRAKIITQARIGSGHCAALHFSLSSARTSEPA